VQRAQHMRLLPKVDEESDMGPCVSLDAALRVQARVDDALHAGARILQGGERDGVRFAPTWLADPPLNHPILLEEIFGPVSTIESVSGISEAIGRLADADDCIHVGLFTQHMATILAVFGAARSAGVIVNDSTDFRIDAMPFGGIGAAGLGREGVRDAIESMTEKKLLVLAC
jgi:glyceraldehyde-3-phosphate dehydrogenase (NADP+)